MRDGHPGELKSATHHFELRDESTQTNHSALHPRGPLAHNFKEAMIEKTLMYKRTNPLQTQWAAPIVSAPEKNESPRFYVDYGNWALSPNGTRVP